MAKATPEAMLAKAQLGLHRATLNDSIDIITRRLLRVTLLSIEIPKANGSQLKFIQGLLEILERLASADGRHLEDDENFQQFMQALGRPTSIEEAGMIIKPGVGPVLDRE